MTDEKPEIPRTTPCSVLVEGGKNYFWCACGRSENQPYCDGSHKGTGITPVAYTAPWDKIVFFCGCKHSGKGPVCDGSHSKIVNSEQ